MESLSDVTANRKPFACGRFSFPVGERTYLMGILNVTPDSFSDGGSFLSPCDAVRQAEQLLQAGADILDVGGESTRPGAVLVDVNEEKRRVIPVIKKLVQAFDCAISVDTSKPDVASEALDAGAVIINDVMGLQQPGSMAQIVADYQAGVVIMHNARLYRTGSDKRMTAQTDIVRQMMAFLKQSIDIAQQAGVRKEQMILDPGIGFGVSTPESIQMIQQLHELKQFGFPVLVGPSRKRFIQESLPHAQADRLMGTAAAVAVSIMRGADFVRVHDVANLIDLVRMTDVLCRQ